MVSSPKWSAPQNCQLPKVATTKVKPINKCLSEPAGSKYPTFEASGAKKHTIHSSWAQKPQIKYLVLGPSGEVQENIVAARHFLPLRCIRRQEAVIRHGNSSSYGFPCNITCGALRKSPTSLCISSTLEVHVVLQDLVLVNRL